VNEPKARRSNACAYQDCCKQLPGPYGSAGVSLSRRDNKTLICSDCGIREAFLGTLVVLLKGWETLP